MLALSEGQKDPMDWAALVWSILSAQGQRVQHEGRVLEHDEENLAVLQARAKAFAVRRLPVCKSLGLLLTQEPEAEPDAKLQRADSSVADTVQSHYTAVA